MAESFFGYPKALHQDAIEKVCRNLDDKLSSKLKENVDYLERLSQLTTDMKRELLYEIDPQRLGRALKLSSQEMLVVLLKGLTSNLKGEILHVLQQPCSVGQVMQDQDFLLKLVRGKEAAGSFIFDDSGELV